jgi:multiple sugar transport system substrate-binding protein
MYVASPEIQRSLYVESGGQPGHRTAWVDSGANELSCSYFEDTLLGLEAGYLRPRYNGALLVQNKGRDYVWEFLRTGGEPNEVLDTIDELYRRSRHGATR